MIFARKTLVRGLAAASAALLIALAAQPGHARSGVKVGVLKCNVAGNASASSVSSPGQADIRWTRSRHPLSFCSSLMPRA